MPIRGQQAVFDAVERLSKLVPALHPSAILSQILFWKLNLKSPRLYFREIQDVVYDGEQVRRGSPLFRRKQPSNIMPRVTIRP
jgi:hypothetical protein